MANTQRAKVIVLEGSDGVGKTTQVTMLSRALWQAGKRAATIKFPMRGTATGDAIYRMLDSGAAAKHPTAFQALQVVDKLIPQIICFPYLLVSNDFIVMDRWNDSCRVYGTAAGVDPRFIRISSQLLMKPDVVLLLDGGGHRVHARQEGDAYERDLHFQSRVRAGYLSLAAEEPSTHVIVDANAPIAAVHNRIWGQLVDRGIV
jgi:dTMP kinase